MKTLRRAALFALSASALLLPLATPASATSAGVIVYAGTATTPPLGYPVLDTTGGNGAVNISSNLACANIGANVLKAGKAPVQAGLCSFTASGTIGTNGLGGPFATGAFCGGSGGTLTGALIDPAGQTVNFSGTFTTVASLVVFVGSATKGAQSGPIVSVADAIPPNPVLGGGSCLDGNATAFTVVGVAVYALL
jgi:hypothetical protein